MKLIVGLGNPGKSFERTVHNVGFAFIDIIRESFGFELSRVWKDSNSQVWEGVCLKEKTILLKPQTFVNLSGRSVLSLVKEYNIQTKDILILQDDVTILPGRIRFKRRSSSGGHNGIKDIINQLKTDHFARIKIGVGNDTKIPLDQWVVKKIEKSKWEEMLSVKSGVFELITNWIKEEN